MDNKNLPAFPVECSYRENGEVKGLQTGNTTSFEMGLTKREIFIKDAMSAYIMAYRGSIDDDELASYAIRTADAVLDKLNKQPSTTSK